MKFAILSLFTLSSFASVDFSLYEQINPKVTKKLISSKSDKKLIFLWASWCATCKVKMKKTIPELKIKNQDTEFVAINLDPDKKRAIHYLKKNKISIPILWENKLSLKSYLGVKAVPHWAYIEKKNGKWEIIHHETGFKKSSLKNFILF